MFRGLFFCILTVVAVTSTTSADILVGGKLGDDQISLIYGPLDGEFGIEAPNGLHFSWLNIESSEGVFTGTQPQLCQTTCGKKVLFYSQFGGSFGSRSFGQVVQPSLEESFLAADLTATGVIAATGDAISGVDLVYLAPSQSLHAGDADMDLDFDQLDLVQVQVAGKYLTGRSADWTEGDWDGAPGGAPGNPPPGNGQFDQTDIIAALGGGIYLTGPYAATGTRGAEPSAQIHIQREADMAGFSVEAISGVQLSSTKIDPNIGVFTTEAAENVDGSFGDNTDVDIFRETFAVSLSSVRFDDFIQTGLSNSSRRADTTTGGSLANGGASTDADLISIPEPSAWALLTIGSLVLLYTATSVGGNRFLLFRIKHEANLDFRSWPGRSMRRSSA